MALNNGVAQMFVMAVDSVLPSDWVSSLRFGSLGLAVLIGLFVLTLANRKSLSGSALALGIVGIVACVAIFAITVFGDRPAQTQSKKLQSELVELCDLSAVKLNALDDGNAKGIAEQMTKVINRALDDSGAGSCVIGAGQRES